jgi:hypothetical protein
VIFSQKIKMSYIYEPPIVDECTVFGALQPKAAGYSPAALLGSH